MCWPYLACCKPEADPSLGLPRHVHSCRCPCRLQARPETSSLGLMAGPLGPDPALKPFRLGDGHWIRGCALPPRTPRIRGWRRARSVALIAVLDEQAGGRPADRRGVASVAEQAGARPGDVEARARATGAGPGCGEPCAGDSAAAGAGEGDGPRGERAALAVALGNVAARVVLWVGVGVICRRAAWSVWAVGHGACGPRKIARARAWKKALQSTVGWGRKRGKRRAAKEGAVAAVDRLGKEAVAAEVLVRRLLRMPR